MDLLYNTLSQMSIFEKVLSLGSRRASQLPYPQSQDTANTLIHAVREENETILWTLQVQLR